MDLTIKICWRPLNTHLSMFITLVFYLLVDMDRLMSITTTLGILCSKGPYGSWWVNKEASEKLRVTVVLALAWYESGKKISLKLCLLCMMLLNPLPRIAPLCIPPAFLPNPAMTWQLYINLGLGFSFLLLLPFFPPLPPPPPFKTLHKSLVYKGYYFP